MSSICIFRRLPCGNFESYLSRTNGWNYFKARRPEIGSGEGLEIDFSEYITALRSECEFMPGMPNSLGIRNYPITACKETGRVEIAEGGTIVAGVGEYYVIECREIFKPGRVRLSRAIKSLGRDYCYTQIQQEEVENNA